MYSCQLQILRAGALLHGRAEDLLGCGESKGRLEHSVLAHVPGPCFAASRGCAENLLRRPGVEPGALPHQEVGHLCADLPELEYPDPSAETAPVAAGAAASRLE